MNEESPDGFPVRAFLFIRLSKHIHRLIGSTAQRLIKRSRKPVFVVPLQPID